jgi:hypothetical protein
MMVYQLSRPLAYLAIHDPAKWKNRLASTHNVGDSDNWRLFSSTRTTGNIWYVSNSLEISGLLQILPGFYIASLAAIATFNKGNMDQYMPEPTPTVNVRVRGHSLPIRLTRRRMLSLLFGYLSFLSLLLFLLIILANSVYLTMKIVIPTSWHLRVALLFLLVYGMLFWESYFGDYVLIIST